MEYENILMNLIGKEKYKIFLTIKNYIETNYDVESIFRKQNIKTKKWNYEWKFVKNGKTFCSFYFTNHCLGYMIIFGKLERIKFETMRNQFSKELLKIYDETENYHDGKWLMLELENDIFLEDIKKLMMLKRKKKQKEQ